MNAPLGKLSTDRTTSHSLLWACIHRTRRLGTQLFFLLTLSIYCSETFSQQAAFPGAEGFGKYATGGRGGKVVEVINRNDTGAGSFRFALTQYPNEPLTVVFRISGIIALRSPLVIQRSNVTIAGQTAPGDGICLKNFPLLVKGAGTGGNKGNIIIRFIRSRPGGVLKTGQYALGIENCQNVIVDHCSFSWSNDICVQMYDNKYTTMQWCIISEALYSAGNSKGVRSFAGMWGGQFASYHHNLIAHHNSYTVRFNGGRGHDTAAYVDYRNNVIYNWASVNACYGGDVRITNAVSRINLVNNFYKPGPATPAVLKFVQALDAGKNSKGTGQWYLSGNIMDADKKLTKNNFAGLDLNAIPKENWEKARSSQPFKLAVTVPDQDAQSAYDEVLRKAGAVFPERDGVDERIVNETRSKTTSGTGLSGKPGIIDKPEVVGGWPVYSNSRAPLDTDHDGMPDDWERSNGLDRLDPNDGNKPGKDGYTMLEIYLNELVSVKNELAKLR